MLIEWKKDTKENNNQSLSFEVITAHDDDRPVYLAGNFNNWTTEDENYRLEKIEKGKYRFVFPNDISLPETLEYKYVKGGWHNVETDIYGNIPPNRMTEKKSGYVSDKIFRFLKDGQAHLQKFLPKLILLTDGKDVTGMRRKRKVWALLPYNYDQTQKHYPVLYLHDAQNLFDDYAPFGNWAIDRKLAILAEQGMSDLIVIAIEHAGKKRIADFSIMPGTTGTQEGRKYVKMIASKLKPYVDAKLRTLTDRQNTGIGGSSLGGLVSIYAGLTFPQVFSKLLIFSPSLWMNPHIHFEAMHFEKTYQTKIYMYAGETESVNMVPNVLRFKETLQHQGVAHNNIHFRINIDPKGKHNEAYWGDEFPKAIEWLFFTN